MSLDFLYSVNEWLVALVFLAMLLLAGETGFRLGTRLESGVEETTKSQVTSLQGAMLALFGLLLAFTFAMAVSRYDLRKQLVVEESTSIGTTYLRAQLLPEPYKSEISRLLRDYVDIRLEFFAVGADPERVAQVSEKTESMQDEIWAQATAAGSLDPRAVTTSLFLQSLNETIDLPTKRLAALQNRIPEVVILLLFFGGMLAVGVVGYGYGLGPRRNVFLMTAFSLLIALVVLVIIDLDRPRRGLITVSQQSMQDLRESLDRSRPWDEQGFWDSHHGSTSQGQFFLAGNPVIGLRGSREEGERKWPFGNLVISGSTVCACTIRGRGVTSPRSCWRMVFPTMVCAGRPWLRRWRGNST